MTEPLKEEHTAVRREVEVLTIKKTRLNVWKQERSKLVSLEEKYVLFIFLPTLIMIIFPYIFFLSSILFSIEIIFVSCG